MQARLQQINEEWKRLEEARERRERLDRRIDDLRAQRRERKEKEQECAGILAKERADVEALEKRGLKSFLAALSGEKEERLSRERREELEAAVRYDQARRDLEYIDDQLRALLGQRETLEDPAGELERLRKEKEALLRGMGGAVGAQLSGLDGQLAPLLRRLREVDEALSAGQQAGSALSFVRAELADAEGLGTWDMLGGGLFVTMAKHEHIDEARAGIDQAQQALCRFRAELADVRVEDVPRIQIGEFATFADYFFDGLFADWAVQSGIHDAQANVEDAADRVEQALDGLRQLRGDLERQVQELERRREELVEQA